MGFELFMTFLEVLQLVGAIGVIVVLRDIIKISKEKDVEEN